MINSLDFFENGSEIIKYPIITDKATRLLENNQYSFIVNPHSNKLAIKSMKPCRDYVFDLSAVCCEFVVREINCAAGEKF